MKLAAAFIAAAMVLAGNGFAQTTAAPTPSSSLAVTPIPPETQAEEANLIRSKIERAGYTDISVLERDNWGVWRGRAKKGDSLVTVVVDKGGRIKSEPAR
jgi:hypothetical protein